MTSTTPYNHPLFNYQNFNFFCVATIFPVWVLNEVNSLCFPCLERLTCSRPNSLFSLYCGHAAGLSLAAICRVARKIAPPGSVSTKLGPYGPGDFSRKNVTPNMTTEHSVMRNIQVTYLESHTNSRFKKHMLLSARGSCYFETMTPN